MNVLTDKSYKSYSKLSRYSQSPYYYHTIDKKYITGTTTYLKNDTPYTTHVVQAGDTFDSIALDYYNNPTYFWIICSFNRIQDPFTELYVGQKIKVPTLSNIEFEVV